MRTLWQLLIFICLTIPIGGGLASAKFAKVGPSGYALTIIVALAVGVCCAWTMSTVGKAVVAHIGRQPVLLRERYARALYFAAMLWIVFALFLGDWVSSAVLRLVF